MKKWTIEECHFSTQRRESKPRSELGNNCNPVPILSSSVVLWNLPIITELSDQADNTKLSQSILMQHPDLLYILVSLVSMRSSTWPRILR